jgi:hypothetical protein
LVPGDVDARVFTDEVGPLVAIDTKTARLEQRRAIAATGELAAPSRLRRAEVALAFDAVERAIAAVHEHHARRARLGKARDELERDERRDVDAQPRRKRRAERREREGDGKELNERGKHRSALDNTADASALLCYSDEDPGVTKHAWTGSSYAARDSTTYAT